MVPPETILNYLAGATQWAMPVAIGWHLALAALVITVMRGWRPQVRTLGTVLTAALLSVAVVAWAGQNPFNTSTFLMLAAGTLASAIRVTAKVQRARRPWIGAGAILAVFAWTYPHFLPAGSWFQYGYAAPLGTIPCPTLAASAGVLLSTSNLPGATRLILAMACLFYGAFGAIYLGVRSDWVLFAGGALLFGQTVLQTRRARIWPAGWVTST